MVRTFSYFALILQLRLLCLKSFIPCEVVAIPKFEMRTRSYIRDIGQIDDHKLTLKIRVNTNESSLLTLMFNFFYQRLPIKPYIRVSKNIRGQEAQENSKTGSYAHVSLD